MKVQGFWGNALGVGKAQGLAQTPPKIGGPPQAAPLEAPASDLAANLPSGFQLVMGDCKFEIPGGRKVTVGRLAGSDLCLQDGLVSREHALVQASPGKVQICDRGSSNGTFVNGERLKPNQWYELKPGATLMLGETELKLRGPASAPPANLAQTAAVQGLSTACQAAPAAIGGIAGQLAKIIDFRELVADPKLQMEKYGSLVPEQPNAYWQNNAEARLKIRDYLDRGDFGNLQEFKTTLQQAHALAVEGSDGRSRYYKGRNQEILGPDRLPAGEFHSGVMGGVRESINAQVEGLAQKYGDPYRNSLTAPAEPVRLPGIAAEAYPQNLPLLGPGQRHLYPSPEAFDSYFTQMQTRLERLQKLPEGATQDEVLKNIGEFYQYAANVRPFHNVNNSLFMNFTNELLQRHGMSPIYHGILDHAAQRLQPEAFNRYFKDWALGEGKIG